MQLKSMGRYVRWASANALAWAVMSAACTINPAVLDGVNSTSTGGAPAETAGSQATTGGETGGSQATTGGGSQAPTTGGGSQVPTTGGDSAGSSTGSTTGSLNNSPTEGLFARRPATQLTAWRFIADGSSLNHVEQRSFDDSGWQSVSVPHTWDSSQETDMVQNANAWYRTHFILAAPADANQQIYLHFEGAFQVADVYLNGAHLGSHRGGYTAFTMDGSAAARLGDNVVAVRVSSASCDDCLPAGRPNLYKGYGGMYRKAWLIKTQRVHVATTDYASSGVYITPTPLTSQAASLSVRTMVSNDTSDTAQVTVLTTVLDGNQVVVQLSDTVSVPYGMQAVIQKGAITSPHLWNGRQDPYLYNLVTTLKVAGVVTDSVTERFGVRSYALSATDFQLNGKSTRLRGVAKHQETEYAATAVADADLVTDWNNLQDLGVNFIRLVHYPHAKLEQDLADKLGFMVWVENGHNDGAGPTANGEYITREMIYQNWNHPAIVFWSAGNEASGVAATSEYAAVINSTDPTRVSTYASDGQTPQKVDFIFHNTYDGWYSNSMYAWLTSRDPWISETGAGMVISSQNPNYLSGRHAVNTLEPEDYGAQVDEVRFNDLFTNPSHVPAFALWLFRDANDSKYKGRLNTKGLMTYSNYKKDVYYHYQSFLKSSPVIHIVGPHYFLRTPNESDQGDVKVYSNAANLHLSVNGSDHGSRTDGAFVRPNGYVIRHVFFWHNVLVPGRNVIRASDDSGNSETITVYFTGGHEALPSEPAALVTNLQTSRGNAYFINLPMQSQYPFYYEFDSTADNTVDVLPANLEGAGWISTQRQSDPKKLTALSFSVQAAADVYVMTASSAAPPAWVAAAGFVDTGVKGSWRTNEEVLVPFSLYKKACAAGAHLSLTPPAVDYVVFAKASATGP